MAKDHLASPAADLALRPYQLEGVKKASSFAQDAISTSRLLLASPTGSGKSYVILEALKRLPGWWAVVPNLDIIGGMLEKLGVHLESTDDAIAGQAEQFRMITPLRLKNRLLAGGEFACSGLILDEGHHDESNTHHDIDAMLDVPKIAITATPFRGTAQGTLRFRTVWGEPQWLIRLADAVEQGVISLPTCETWPLVDDDLVEVRGGELDVSQIVGSTRDKLEDLLDRCIAAGFFDATGKPTRPTVIAVPSGVTAEELQARCLARGLKSCFVTQATPRILRNEIYNRARAGTHALINVKVVGEGVDLPLRQFIDLSPTLSPVLWMQRLGRITRPAEEPPHYVCCNRNLMRHFYLLDGALPPIYLQAAITEFGGLSARAGARAFGLEGVGKLRPIEVRLQNGLTIHCYSVTQTKGASQEQFFVIVHPLLSNPVWASRENVKEGEAMTWGKWKLCEAPSELRGFKSLPIRSVSVNQLAWWERDAARFGLAGEPNTKTFPILPVLANIGMKLK